MYSWWLCIILMTWIHGVWLVAMAYICDFIHLWSEHGNAYLKNGMILCRCLFVCRFLIDALLVFDIHILQSISTTTSSIFILSREFYYTLFWSPQWSSDNMCLCSLKILKIDFLHGKSDLLSSFKNHVKEGRRTLPYAWGVMMPYHRTLP